MKRAAKATKKAQLEGRFLAAWSRLFPNLPRPTMEHRFCHARKWRIDFAFVEQKVAVELDGGAFIRGGHVRGAQQAKDYEKQNALVRLGWRVLRFNTLQMKDPDECATITAELLCDAKEVA